MSSASPGFIFVDRKKNLWWGRGYINIYYENIQEIFLSDILRGAVIIIVLE